MKKLICVLLVLATLLCAAGCGASSKEQAAPEPGETQLLDGAGRILDIPDDPSSATIASVYAVSVPFVVALGLSDRTVAVNPKTKFWTTADENLSTNSVGRGVVDLEALAALNPTALIHRSNDPETVTAVENIGVDVICITVENMEDIKYTLRILGSYFGVPDRAEEVIGIIESKFEMISGIVAGIPEEERVTALLLGGEPGRISGNDMLQSWMIETAGGICVADEGKDHNWIDVGVEKVFEYNPEYIFCTSSTGLDYTVDELLNDPAWSAVTAIRNENVFIMPAKIDCWDIPGLSCVLGTMYMLHAMYPDYFSAEELQREIDEYYTFMFGTTFEQDYLGYSLG